MTPNASAARPQEDDPGQVDVEAFTRRFEHALWPVRDTEIRRHIVRLFLGILEAAVTRRFDVLVLTARRMSCLYSLAQICGFRLPPDVWALSDRYPELQAHNWQPREGEAVRIILLDDVIDTGRGMDKRIQRFGSLTASDAAEVEMVTGAICASEENAETEARRHFAERRASYLPEPIPVTREDRADLAQDFAQGLTSALVPLVTDFPVTQRLDLATTDFDRILKMSGWRSFDVTNSFVAGTGVRCYTMFPDGHPLTELGIPEDLVDICKVRLFTYQRIDRVDVRIAPMVVVHPLHKDSVTDCFRLFGQRFGGVNTAPVISDENAAGFGLISYWLSLVLLDVFRIACRAEIEEQTESREIRIDTEIQSNYLGRRLQAVFDDLGIANGAVDGPDFSRLQEPLQLLRALPPSSPGEDDNDVVATVRESDGITVVGDATDVERLARKLKAFAETQAITAGPDRGYMTLGDIEAEFGHSRRRCSLAVDVLHDQGLLVPTNREKDGLLLRAYRKGEIVTKVDDLPPGLLGGRFASVPETLFRRWTDEVGTEMTVLGAS